MSAEVRQMVRQAAASRNADAMLRAGAAALKAGAEAEAAPAVETVLRDHPGNARLWQLLGLLYRGLDDLAPAIAAFAKAAELAPDDAMIAHGRAAASFEAGLPALPLFERALRLSPSGGSIRLGRAAAQIAEGQGEAAVAELDRQLAREPGWVEGHGALARLRWARGDREGFAASFDRALLTAPREIPLWRAYIETLLRAELYEQALDVIARGRAAAGVHPTFDAAEAIARAELQETEPALALFDRIGPHRNIATTVHYVRLLIRNGRIEEATRIAEQRAPQDATHQLWPYVSIGWRLLGDPRWEWLEGDPRFIGVYDIADQLPPLDALAERLRTLHRATHQPLDQSVRGGTQTEGNLFPRLEPEIRALRQAIVEAVKRHAAQLPPPEPGHPLLIGQRAPIRFAGSWSVRLTGGGRHSDHVHPSGWLSSALYIALPDEAERGGAEAGWLTLGEAKELGVDLPPIRMVEPKPGRLVLFPSTMWHGTRPFEAGERLTVAFDVRRPGG